jgi:hypothetical protein
MQTAAATPNPVGLAADQMAGDWAVARGSGKVICTITLTNTGPGPNNFSLKLKPGCDAFVTRFSPSTWHMDRGELVLKSAKGQFWALRGKQTYQLEPRPPRTRGDQLGPPIAWAAAAAVSTCCRSRSRRMFCVSAGRERQEAVALNVLGSIGIARPEHQNKGLVARRKQREYRWITVR